MSGDWTGSPFPPPPLFPFALDHWFFPQLDRGCKLTEGSAHLQTWPPDLIPFCSLYCPGFSSHTFDTLFFCVSTKRQDQAAKEAGGLGCGTKLISTGIWRRKPRYPTPPTTPISPFFLSPSLLWRLPPSSRLHHQVCEGCHCQLSLSWTTANLSSCLLSVPYLFTFLTLPTFSS